MKEIKNTATSNKFKAGQNTSSSLSMDPNNCNSSYVNANSSLVHTIEYQAKEILRLNEELNKYKAKYHLCKKRFKEMDKTDQPNDKSNDRKISRNQDSMDCKCTSNFNRSQLEFNFLKASNFESGQNSSIAAMKRAEVSKPLERRKSTLLGLFKKTAMLNAETQRKNSPDYQNPNSNNLQSKIPLTSTGTRLNKNLFRNITNRRLANSSLLIGIPQVLQTTSTNAATTTLNIDKSTECQNSGKKMQTPHLQQSTLNQVRKIRNKSRGDLIGGLCIKDTLFTSHKYLI